MSRVLFPPSLLVVCTFILSALLPIASLPHPAPSRRSPCCLPCLIFPPSVGWLTADGHALVERQYDRQLRDRNSMLVGTFILIATGDDYTEHYADAKHAACGSETERTAYNRVIQPHIYPPALFPDLTTCRQSITVQLRLHHAVHHIIVCWTLRLHH